MTVTKKIVGVLNFGVDKVITLDDFFVIMIDEL